MGDVLTNEQLREKALSVLRKQLSPVEVIRFLSMARQQPRDYVQWRHEHFKNIESEELIQELQKMS